MMAVNAPDHTKIFVELHVRSHKAERVTVNRPKPTVVQAAATCYYRGYKMNLNGRNHEPFWFYAPGRNHRCVRGMVTWLRC